jgi:hypothetical protein
MTFPLDAAHPEQRDYVQPQLGADRAGGPALGLSSAQVDALFVAAAAINP